MSISACFFPFKEDIILFLKQKSPYLSVSQVFSEDLKIICVLLLLGWMVFTNNFNRRSCFSEKVKVQREEGTYA